MIIIAPFSQKLRNGKNNPKNYPHFKKLLACLALLGEHVVQVGVDGEEQLVEDFRKNLSLDNLATLVKQCRTWISVDSFFQHFCWDLGVPGIVLWGQSDPNIFGHPENINLLKDRSYLRENQFWMWEQCEYRDDCWVPPEEVLKHLNK